MNLPAPVDNPDFSEVIALAKDIISCIADGSWHEDNDDAHYMYEEVMNAVFGKDIWKWINENTD